MFEGLRRSEDPGLINANDLPAIFKAQRRRRNLRESLIQWFQFLIMLGVAIGWWWQ
jgi:hypothetical protein